MRKLFVFLLCVCSSVFAEPQLLAPVVDNSSYPAGAAINTEKPFNNAMYEIFGRLEQMQLEIQELRGLVEEQSHTISELDKRQKNIYSDLDLRLQELTRGNFQERSNEYGGSQNQLSGNADSLIKNSSVDNTISSGLGLSQNQQPENGISLINPSNADKTNPHKSTSMNSIQNRKDGVVSEPSVENEKTQYQAAYGMLRNGHNKQAIAEFKQLLIKFPDGEFASNSQYWLGEAYKVMKDITSAKRAFSKVVSHYGRSAKVPDALLKLGYIELEQNNKVSARDYLTQITTRYPDSTAAHLAKKKLLQMENMNP